MKIAKTADKHLLALGIATAALLTLSACGGSGDEEPEGEDQGAEEAADESDEAETSDQDEAEGASAEEDGDTDDAAAAEDADDTDAADVDEVPDWSEVTSLASAAMEEAESVSMQISAPYAGAIMPNDPEEAGDVEVGDPMVQEVTGEIFGNATYVETIDGTETTFHFQGPETILISLEDELAAAEEQGTPIRFTADDVDGDYVDYSQELGGQINFVNFISETQAAMLEFDAPEGEGDTRDGEDVWVYTEGEDEAVLLADSEAPLPLLLSFDVNGETYEFQLSDWDSAEVPEDIDQDEIASQADLEDAAQL